MGWQTCCDSSCLQRQRAAGLEPTPRSGKVTLVSWEQSNTRPLKRKRKGQTQAVTPPPRAEGLGGQWRLPHACRQTCLLSKRGPDSLCLFANNLPRVSPCCQPSQTMVPESLTLRPVGLPGFAAGVCSAGCHPLLSPCPSQRQRTGGWGAVPRGAAAPESGSRVPRPSCHNFFPGLRHTSGWEASQGVLGWDPRVGGDGTGPTLWWPSTPGPGPCRGPRGRAWDLPLPALPMTNTEWRTCSSSSSCTTFSTKLSSACSLSSVMLCLMIWGHGRGRWTAGARAWWPFPVGELPAQRESLQGSSGAVPAFLCPCY